MYSNADDGARPARRLKLQRPASYSTNRHIQFDHFVILTISCGKAPYVSTHPALPRLEQSRRPYLDENRFLASVVAPAIRHRGLITCRVSCMQHKHLAFQFQRHFAVDHAKELTPGGLPSTSCLRAGIRGSTRTAVLPPYSRCVRTNVPNPRSPKNSSGLPRPAKRSSDGMSKKDCVVTLNTRALPASECGGDETRTRTTCSPNRSGNNGRHCRLIERPIQPPATWANHFAEHRRSRVALCKCKNHIRNINRRQN